MHLVSPRSVNPLMHPGWHVCPLNNRSTQSPLKPFSGGVNLQVLQHADRVTPFDGSQHASVLCAPQQSVPEPRPSQVSGLPSLRRSIGGSHVAAWKIPARHVEFPDTRYGLSHSGRHDPRSGRSPTQSPADPCLGIAMRMLQPCGLQRAGLSSPPLQVASSART